MSSTLPRAECLVIWASLLSMTVACAPTFDPASELSTLRVMAVQKDKPYARPGEDVELHMLWQDASSEESRQIQIQWWAGCYNPPGDLFAGCFADGAWDNLLTDSGRLSSPRSAQANPDPLGNDAGPSDAGIDADAGSGPEQPGAPTLSMPFDERVLGGGDFQIKVGYGETFSFRMPTQIVSARPRAPGDPTPPYGVAYVFFAICAGEVRVEPASGAFPLSCYDGNRRLDHRDFVAGYTAVYAYEDAAISNDNPQITGLLINGQAAAVDCIGEQCSGLLSPASPQGEDSCSDTNTLQHCPSEKDCAEVSIKPVIDQSQPAEEDAVLREIRGQSLPEQMWINYYVDRGDMGRDLRLLNDAVTGWNAEYEAEYLPTESGTAHVWAVAHDNRGGVEWVRARICIEP